MNTISLCCKASSESDSLSRLLHLDATHQLMISDSLPEIESLWQTLEPSGNGLLQSEYLRALEQAPILNGRPYYLIFYREETPIGLAYCNFLHFRGLQAMNGDLLDEGRALPNRLARAFKKTILGFFNVNLLVCGNLLNTGQTGFYFRHGELRMAEKILLVEKGLKKLTRHLQNQGKRVDAFFWKDFYTGAADEAPLFSKLSYHGVPSYPNMVLDIPPDWKTYQDYLGSLISKYRVRARRARKKARDLHRRELSGEEVLLMKDKLYALFQEVSKEADFNMADVHPDYFASMKRRLGRHFRVWGYFDEADSLVGFNTHIENGQVLEAHFLGYPAALNFKHQLYLNILLDIIADGIEGGFKQVHFARTAMEIKSSVGAKPKEIHTYLRYRNGLVNWMLKPILSFLEPDFSWTPRHPFKAD